MARATDFLSQTSGKLDEMFQTRQTDHGTILARNPKRRGMTRRSEKQANTRCQLANVSANYQLFRCKKMQTFEGKEAGQNDFNIFVQVNYDRNPVFITKQDRKCGGCVLGNYQYSLGSLNPIAISLTSAGSAQGGGVLVTNIGLGSLVIDANTTVGEFSAAVLANNKDWQTDDQLTFFYAEQMVDSEGVPRASMDPYRMVMNTTDQTKLWNVVSALGFSSVAAAGTGYVLGMGIALSNAGGSWIHSRNDGDGEKQVSTQRMKVVSDILASYQGEAAFLASAKSYGGINTREDFLDPVSTMADLGVASATVNAGGTEMSSGGGSGSGSGSGTQSGGSGSGTQQGGNSGGNSGGAETPTVTAPTISGDTPFEESTEVTMSGPADATIHYTLDGSTPTSASTAYTEALTLTDTTTVKAIAVKDGVSSTVASRTFTKGSGSGGGLQGED